ncbi:DUF6580 family putative transport protein [Bremerella sp. JC817]|uniref:DUF6580 family putative transport protein n=1 Tax=Bremerella sp. JC817 TaxID=3231756 RepID=UPI0034578CD5
MPDSTSTSAQRPTSLRIWLVVGLCLAYCVAIRVLPYVLTAMGTQAEWFTMNFPWSLTPILAVGLFAGATFRNPWVAGGLLLAALVASDLGIWAVSGHFNWAFYVGTPFNYLCMLATIGLGLTLRNDRSWIRPIGTGLMAALIFFVVTNFASWITLPEYTKDLSGLASCYVAAIPFFRNMMIGTVVGTVLLFNPVVLSLLLPGQSGEVAGNQSPSFGR